MTNNQKKGYMPHVVNWQIAYAARELRHNKSVTLSCLDCEKDFVYEQLNSFSNSSPIVMKTVNKANPGEVFVEFIEAI